MIEEPLFKPCSFEIADSELSASDSGRLFSESRSSDLSLPDVSRDFQRSARDC